MLLPITFCVSLSEFPNGAPETYLVGAVVYVLQGREKNGDPIYKLKKIPKQKVFTQFIIPS